MGTVSEHSSVQSIAKGVLKELVETIVAGDTEQSIADRAAVLLAAHGITETWYYNCRALVLLGSRSCLSISGREYIPSDEPVGLTNVFTIDLSPSHHGVWGDCARTFFVEDGKCIDVPRSPEFQRGAAAMAVVHDQMRAFVTVETTCEDLFEFANRTITSHGFENLDFLRNVGHSIESSLDRRCYIEAGNRRRLSDIGLFTFEPHIRHIGGTWGFKHENIYYFGSTGSLEEL